MKIQDQKEGENLFERDTTDGFSSGPLAGTADDSEEDELSDDEDLEEESAADDELDEDL